MVESGVWHFMLSDHGATLHLIHQVILNNALLFSFNLLLTLYCLKVSGKLFRMLFVQNLFIMLLLIFQIFYFEVYNAINTHII